MAKWSISLETLAKRTGQRLEAVQRKFAFELFTAVVERSPVDTGRFRANWMFSNGTPSSNTVDVAGAKGSPAAASSEPSKVLTATLGGTLYLCNSLPYAIKLEKGWSQQAPSGMVALSIREAQQFVRNAIAGARSA